MSESLSTESFKGPKNLVICCDGTGNMFGDDNSNVVKLYTALEVDRRQVAYYHPGVGTMGAANVSGRAAKLWSQVKGMAFGAGFTANLSDAYQYLMNHYVTGDRIYLFGFSRGAYTVRALAAALHVYGLLCAGNEGHLPYVMEMFAAISKEAYDKAGGISGARTMHGDAVADAFKQTYAREVAVHFMGIWDTVSSVGWITDPVKLLYDGQNPIVQTCYHAVSVDERRCFFQDNLWGAPLPMSATRVLSEQGTKAQKVVQAWFAGVHSDVGGSYVQAESWPAMQAFEWMLDAAIAEGLEVNGDRRAAVECLPGLGFEAIRAHYCPAAAEWVCLHESLRGAWWLLEFFPHKYYDAAGKRQWQMLPWAHRREIPDGALLHPSLLRWLKREEYAPKNLDRRCVVPFGESPVPYPQEDLVEELKREGYGVYRLKGGAAAKGAGGMALGVAAALLVGAFGWWFGGRG